MSRRRRGRSANGPAPVGSEPAGAGEREALQVERFEYVEANATTALLRVVVRGRPEADEAGPLTAHRGSSSEDFRPLAPGDTGEWMLADSESYALAFPVPVALVADTDATFTLRTASGPTLALGRPRLRPLRGPGDHPDPTIGRGSSTPLSRRAADEVRDAEGELRSLVDDVMEVERRAVGLRTAIRRRAGVEDRAPRRPSLGEPPREGTGAERIARLRDEVDRGAAGVDTLEAQIAKLAHRLRTAGLGGAGPS